MELQSLLAYTRAVAGNCPGWEAKGMPQMGWCSPLVSAGTRMGAVVWAGHGCSLLQYGCGLGLGNAKLGQIPATTGAHEGVSG